MWFSCVLSFHSLADGESPVLASCVTYTICLLLLFFSCHVFPRLPLIDCTFILYLLIVLFLCFDDKGVSSCDYQSRSTSASGTVVADTVTSPAPGAATNDNLYSSAYFFH